MILIADSGSTKTDWCVVEKGKLIQQISTKGTNPFFQSEEEISNEIATALLPQLTTNAFDAVYSPTKLPWYTVPLSNISRFRATK